MIANNNNFFLIDKLSREVNALASLRYKNTKSLDCYCYEEGDHPFLYPPKDVDWSAWPHDSRWRGRDKYLWVKTSFNYSVIDKENQLFVYADFGTTDEWHNSGFESLCFLDGKPFQGVDQNHKEMILPENLNGKNVAVHFKLWSGLEGGGPPKEIEHQFKTLFVGELDTKVDKLYYLSKTMMETAKQLPDDDENKLRLLDILDSIFLKLNWSLQGNQEELYENLHVLSSILEAKISELQNHSDVEISAVGHTHIDVAWLWRLKHTREKCARSFSTVLRYMKLYPEYIFYQGQPQLYEYIKNDYPEIYEEIKRKVAEGRWEPNGAMWVEADCNVTTGESLVRQILMGKRFFKEEFDVDCDVLWLPDVFGYSWALPQILKKSGISTFITSKISWNKFNKMPYDTFMWRGMDGSEVLTHFIITPEVPEFQQEWQSPFQGTYNGHLTPYTVKKTWEKYTSKDIFQGQIIPFGYGDGGGGVDRTMLEMYSGMKSLPGIPKVKQEKVSDFTRKLHEAYDHTEKYVHVWDGELYLEYHRGTYTSQGFIKKANRQLEFKYRLAEILSILEVVESNDYNQYRQKSLNDGWKIILRNQFHDIIPGSSITEVYEDAKQEYQLADQLASEVITGVVEKLVEDDADSYTVFNSSSFEGKGMVLIQRDGMVSFTESDGMKIPTVKVEGGYLVTVKGIPSTGFKTIRVSNEPEENIDCGFSYGEDEIKTPFYKVIFENGKIRALYDIEEDRNVLADVGNVFEVFEDRPLNFDAWEIEVFYNDKKYDVNQLIFFGLKERNSLRLIVNVKWQYKNSLIDQDIIFYSYTRRIDFKTEVHWAEQQQMLKVKFPVDIRASKATYDIQFGNIERPTHWNTSWDLAKFEVVGHKWTDLSEGNYGVALLNDCKYGYDIKDNNIRLSLIKSAIHPDPLADQGLHTFTYALYPHKGSFKESDVEAEAWALNNPLICMKGKKVGKVEKLIALNKDHVVIDTIKKAEDRKAIIIRVHEYLGCRSTIELSCGFKYAAWQEVDLMENPLSEPLTTKIEFNIKPYEIKTLLVELN